MLKKAAAPEELVLMRMELAPGRVTLVLVQGKPLLVRAPMVFVVAELLGRCSP